jgi:hypothetical protein
MAPKASSTCMSKNTRHVLTDITQFLLAHGDVALTNDMLKDQKVDKAYEYFSSGWLQEGYFLKAKSNNNNNLPNMYSDH